MNDRKKKKQKKRKLENNRRKFTCCLLSRLPSICTYIPYKGFVLFFPSLLLSFGSDVSPWRIHAQNNDIDTYITSICTNYDCVVVIAVNATKKKSQRTTKNRIANEEIKETTHTQLGTNESSLHEIPFDFIRSLLVENLNFVFFFFFSFRFVSFRSICIHTMSTLYRHSQSQIHTYTHTHLLYE